MLPFGHDKGSHAYLDCALDIIKKNNHDANFISIMQFPTDFIKKYDIKMVAPKSQNRVFSFCNSIGLNLDLILCKIFSANSKPSSTSLKILKTRCRLKSIIESDIVVHLGLDHYADYGGIKTVAEHSKEIRIVNILKKPILLFSQSLGPFFGKKLSSIALKALKDVDLICPRESVSLGYLANLGLDKNAVATSDPAFLLDTSDSKTIESILSKEHVPSKTKKRVGVVISGYNLHSLGGKKSPLFVFSEKLHSAMLYFLPKFLLSTYSWISSWIFSKTQNLSSQVGDIPKLLDYLIENIGANILLVSHCNKAGLIDDTHLLLECAQASKYASQIHIIKNDYSPPEIKGLLGTCDFVISTKMHACIAAVSQCIPAIAIAWSHKYRGVMRDIGLENFVVESLESGAIVKKIDELNTKCSEIQSILYERIPKIKEQSNLPGRLIKEMLGNF